MTSPFPNLVIGVVDARGKIEPGQPIVQRIDARQFRLIEPYAAEWYENGGRYRLTVPAGFLCDLASIPRILHVLLPKGGLHDGPSVLHDYCYVELWRTRATSDLLFLYTLMAAGTRWVRRNIMYAGVRSGGWVLWNKRARQQED